jgi:hypothetical protein
LHQLAGALDGSFPVADALGALRDPDAVSRRAASVRQQGWIAEGVRAFRARSPSDLVHEWSALTDAATDVILDALTPDVVVHLFDLLGSAGSRAHRDEPMVAEALAFWAGVAGPPARDLDADAFELLRAITGRRSRDQAPWAPASLALYGWRETPLIE